MVFKVLLVLLNLSALIYITRARTKYNIDIVEADTYSNDLDIFDFKFNIVRPSRGVLALSAYIETKQDIDTDRLTFEVKIYYSPGGNRYQLSPFRIPPQSMTQVFNGAYQLYVRESSEKCCTNAPGNETFVSPYPKRVVECDSCQFGADNLPSALRTGYYKLVLLVYHKPTANCTILLKLEVA